MNLCARVGMAVLMAAMWNLGLARAQTLATGDSRTVTEPTFPKTCATVTAQQAIVSGGPASETAFDTSSIQAALTACSSGQAVELAASGANNAFLIQPITIPAGVGLIVDGGVTVFASRNPADYQTSHTEQCGSYGTSGNGCNALINFASGSGSGLYGYGVIDARGGSTMLGGPNSGISWWTNADNATTAGESQDNPIIIHTSGVNSLTLYKITLRNSPMFHVSWSGNGLTAWGIKISAPFTAHNTDGIDPSGSNVTINYASISDGDDNVAVNASSASSNITVENTTTYSGHGISVGSYTQGGLTNFLVNQVNMAGTAQDGNAIGIRLKSSEDRGGTIQTVTYENMCIRDTRYPIEFNPFYNTNTGTLIPSFQNIVLSGVHVLSPTTSQYPYLVWLQGHDSTHLSTITLDNVVFDALSASQVSPAPEYETFALAGNVYPAALQSLSGTDVTYNGTATSTAGTGVSACTGVYPYLVGELYASTATGTNLGSTTISPTGSVTLNAMVEPAMSQTSYSGTVGTWTGVAAPSAKVNFYEGTSSVGSGTLGANGTLASVTLNNLTVGTHTYTAQYAGDSNYGALTFGSVTVIVSSGTTATTTALSAPATGTFGTATTLSATVTGSGGTPTGNVAFYDGTVLLGETALSGGTASFAVAFSGGAHSVNAVYSGDSTFLPSSSTSSTVTIATVTSTTGVTADPTTVSQNLTTNLTATVTGLSGKTLPTGTITFTDGAANLGSATLSSGVATLTATMATVGSRTVTASYGGDTNYKASSGTVSVTVTSTTSTTTLTAPSTSAYGTPITLSVKITSATSGTPSGTVTFYDGTVNLGTATLASAAGSLANLVLSGGSHTLTAVYSGDSTFPASTSVASSLAVSQATSSTALVVSPTSTVALATINLTATVTGVAGGATPTGNVIFSDGTTVLGTGAISGSTATLATALTTAGSNTITAAYGGDVNYLASSATAAETVTTVATTTTLSLSSSSVYGGQSVTLTATVTPATSGTVQFLVNSTQVGTGTVGANGMATYSYTLPASSVGSLSVTAAYAAGTTFAASTSSSQVLTVGTAFILTAPNSLTVTAGSSGTVALSVQAGGGFSGSVGLTCTSPVSYITCSVASSLPVSGTTAATTTVTINVAATTGAVRTSHSNVIWAMLAPFGLFGLAWGARRRKTAIHRLMFVLLLAASCFSAGAALSGCAGGGGGSSSSGSTSSTPTGSDMVTITGTSSGVTQTAQVNVTI